MKNNLYVVLKTILYRILSVLGNTGFLYILIGNITTAGKFAVAVAIFHTVFYYLYEKIATKFEEKYIYKIDK